jgi:hypothetical protein
LICFEFFRPVFNFADASISVGVGLIILFQKRFFGKKTIVEEQANAESTANTISDFGEVAQSHSEQQPN